MIITRSPLRLSLGGGGTDLPSYYTEHSGFLIAAALDRYVYITLHHGFEEELIIKYSRLERVTRIEDIQHPIIREALALRNIAPQYLEITSLSDIPSGTGLGSSGAFTTALLHSLDLHCKNPRSRETLARDACHIEIDRLKEPVGKQDQYIAAYGGITAFTFHPDHKVGVEPLPLSAETLHALEDNLLLVFTGYTRSAGSLLSDQDTKSRAHDPAMIANLHKVKEMGLASRDALLNNDLRTFAEIMHVHWENKRRRSANMSNSHIDDLYDLARRNGALGGKVVGAGGGGFLMLYTENKTQLRHVLCGEHNLRELRFRFDFEGTALVTRS